MLVRGHRLPRPGESCQAGALHEAPGGRGANQAIAAARLGARVALATCVGNDARADVIVQRLYDAGVDTKHVAVVRATPTGVAAIQVGGDGVKQVMGFRGANSALAALDIDRIAASLEQAGVLLMQLEAGVPVTTRLAIAARRAGCRVVLDAAPAHALPDTLVEHLFLMRANAEEASAITGIEVADRRTARTAARMMLQRGAKAACIQAGRAGDVLMWRSAQEREYEEWLPRHAVSAIDSTGAGDAFAATLAVLVARHHALGSAGRLASAAAALTTTKLGAQAAFPSLPAINAFMSGRRTLDVQRPSPARR